MVTKRKICDEIFYCYTGVTSKAQAQKIAKEAKKYELYYARVIKVKGGYSVFVDDDGYDWRKEIADYERDSLPSKPSVFRRGSFEIKIKIDKMNTIMQFNLKDLNKLLNALKAEYHPTDLKCTNKISKKDLDTYYPVYEDIQPILKMNKPDKFYYIRSKDPTYRNSKDGKQPLIFVFKGKGYAIAPRYVPN